MSSATATSSQETCWDHLRAIPRHFSDLTQEEPKDTIECVITALEAVGYTNASDQTKAWCQRAADELNPIKKAFAIVSLPFRVNSVRRDVNKMCYTDDWSKVTPQLFTDVVFTAHAASESMLCLNAYGWIELTKEAMSMVKGVFWGALGIFDLYNLFVTHPESFNELTAEIEKSTDPVKQNILNYKLNRTYLETAKSVIIVGMAAISLVSLFFASLAQGVLFSPVTMFALGASWSTLFLTSFFYGKMIEVEERHLLYGKL